MLNKDEVLEGLRGLRHGAATSENRSFVIIADDAITLINSQSAEIERLQAELAEARKMVPGWIPVAERLPEDEAIVLVWIGEELATTKGQEVQIARAHLTKEDDKYAVAPVTFSFKRAGFLGGNEVTHWMPLPTTPQETKE